MDRENRKLENEIYSVDDIYNVPKDEAEKLRIKAIKRSFEHHYAKSPFYGKYCKENNVSPEDIKTTEDFKKIPLITDRFFKGYPEPNKNPKRFLKWIKAITPWVPDLPHMPANIDGIVSELYKQGLSLLFSSGSSGIMSFVPYDKTTIDRKKRHLVEIMHWSGMMEDSQKQKKDLTVIVFCPNPSRSCMGGVKMLEALENVSDEVWWATDLVITPSILKMMVGTGDSKYSISKNNTEKNRQDKYIKRVIDKVVEMEHTKEKNVVIAGTPGPLYGILRMMEEKDTSVDIHDNGWIIVSGGWENISQIEFKKKIKKVLGIPPVRCISMYAMTETSSIMPSCTDGDSFYHHVPYFTQVYARSDDGELSEEGRGRLVFLDPMPTSYPCFIVTGDEGEILPKCPLCGREGQVITNVGRKEGEEAKGCRIALDRMQM